MAGNLKKKKTETPVKKKGIIGGKTKVLKGTHENGKGSTSKSPRLWRKKRIRRRQ